MSAHQAPTSFSQARLVRLLNMTPEHWYSVTADQLEAAGYTRTGIPIGYTWRTARVLPDAELLRLTKIDRTAQAEAGEGIDGQAGAQ